MTIGRSPLAPLFRYTTLFRSDGGSPLPPENVSDVEFLLSFDLFDGDSGADDDVIEVIYTYTPVPLPAAWLLLAPALGWMSFKRRAT